MSEPVVIHTDGACKYPPLQKGDKARGPGGWGAVLRWNGNEKHLLGGELETTNNRMELTAAIRALESLKRPCRVEIHTDSNYVRSGITEWLPRWKKKNWRGSNRKPVANADLWARLDELASGHEVAWFWVKGHDGNPDNELADALANQGVEKALAEAAE